MDESTKTELTEAQKARIEKNRIRAQHLRQARFVSSHPYMKAKDDNIPNTVKLQATKRIDSGGGFFIEEPVSKEPTKTPEGSLPSSQPTDAIAIPVTYEECLDCGTNFIESYLMTNFDYSVCDECRDPDDKHSLITKTEAKQEYLLKDCDLDRREPPLKFITRKNPHHVSWGEMKLYLHLQVEKRALEVWKSEDAILKQREKREDDRHVAKIKKYNKKMKSLKMEVRSSLYDKTVSASHTHTYGPETYNEDDDNYTHVCIECKFVETFEKM